MATVMESLPGLGYFTMRNTTLTVFIRPGTIALRIPTELQTPTEMVNDVLTQYHMVIWKVR